MYARKILIGCLSHAPSWGPGLQPRHVPRLGVEPAPLWFAARAQSIEPHQPGQKIWKEDVYGHVSCLSTTRLALHPIIVSGPLGKRYPVKSITDNANQLIS